MSLAHRLGITLRGSRVGTARRSRRTSLAVERLDARIALAVDQFWVAATPPPPSSAPLGSITNPFVSVEQARDAIRSRLAAGPQRRDIVVNVRGGTYDLSEPLTFIGADSGKSGRTVTWRAATGETPVFSGSRQVTGWTPVANPGLVGLGTNIVWKADVSSLSNPGRTDIFGLPEFRARQLYIDGVRGTIAETMPSAMPEDLFPQYPYGFRPFIGQYSFLGTTTPVNGIAYSNPGDVFFNSNAADWRDPTTWGDIPGVPDVFGLR